MFRLITSNDTAKLADQLGERLCAPTAHPLVPVRVLVPQAGLQYWLQTYLAERLGVVANVVFTPPARFAWELLRAAQPDLRERSPFEPDVLRWHLHALLGEAREGAAAAPVRDYLAGDGDPLRRYALAGALAHVYERMQGYRRRKLLVWERDPNLDDWQAALWRRLLKRTGGASRASRVEAWLTDHDPEYPPGAKAVDKPAPPGLPAQLAVFACANVSPDVLRMLAVAGRHCDIDFFLPLPSMEYLGDTPHRRREVWEWLHDKREGSPLIVANGGALGKFVELLYDYEHVQPDEEIDTFDTQVDRGTLLGRVRDDILHHAAPKADDRRAMDTSMQFHACHTSLREVETLHDALLALFEHDRELEPRDVAVMMPDVTAYQPAIEAVFGGIDHDDPRWIPFHLGDVGATTLHPVAKLFEKLLDVPTSRWEASELLDVLAVPGVVRQFDLGSDAIERLSRWVRDAGVCWGEDEHARAECGGYREFSWSFGLDRMLAGFAAGDLDADALVGGTAPLAGVEGAAFSHLDAVLAITETWRHLREQSRRARTARAWQGVLNEALDGLYQPDPADPVEARALQRVREALAELAGNCSEADPDIELAWAEVRAFLGDALADPDVRQHLFTGGVTFCGMVPLRVVPFRVICLLGMDEGAFPRREPSGLDPLLRDRRAGHAEKGDRDVRADDRLLFLELLCAARDVFYVSWIGRDAHTNETLAPSVAVAELMDVLREGYLAPPPDAAARAAPNARLPCLEPLHPFDASLFDARTPRSYAKEWLAAAAPPEAESVARAFVADNVLPPIEPAPLGSLTLDALRGFLLDPARGFLERGLDLRLPSEQREDADDEPLSPGDGLTRWRLTRALLESDASAADGDRNLLGARGLLPPRALGDEALREAHVRADALRAAVVRFTDRAARLPAQTLCVDWGDGTRLEGAPADVYPRGVLHLRPGAIDGRQVLSAWLEALLCTAARAEKPMVLVGLVGTDACAFRLPQLTPEQARAHLRALLALYYQGSRQPLPFFVRTSWDHALTCAKTERKSGDSVPEVDVSAFAKAARQAARADGFGAPSELASAAACIVWRGQDLPGGAGGELAQRLHDTSMAVFAQPARAWVEQFP